MPPKKSAAQATDPADQNQVHEVEKPDEQLDDNEQFTSTTSKRRKKKSTPEPQEDDGEGESAAPVESSSKVLEEATGTDAAAPSQEKRPPAKLKLKNPGKKVKPDTPETTNTPGQPNNEADSNKAKQWKKSQRKGTKTANAPRVEDATQEPEETEREAPDGGGPTGEESGEVASASTREAPTDSATVSYTTYSQQKPNHPELVLICQWIGVKVAKYNARCEELITEKTSKTMEQVTNEFRLTFAPNGGIPAGLPVDSATKGQQAPKPKKKPDPPAPKSEAPVQKATKAAPNSAAPKAPAKGTGKRTQSAKAPTAPAASGGTRSSRQAPKVNATQGAAGDPQPTDGPGASVVLSREHELEKVRQQVEREKRREAKHRVLNEIIKKKGELMAAASAAGFDQEAGPGHWVFKDEASLKLALDNFASKEEYGFYHPSHPSAFEILMIRDSYKKLRPDLPNPTDKIEIIWKPHDLAKLKERLPELTGPVTNPPYDFVPEGPGRWEWGEDQEESREAAWDLGSREEFNVAVPGRSFPTPADVWKLVQTRKITYEHPVAGINIVWIPEVREAAEPDIVDLENDDKDSGSGGNEGGGPRGSGNDNDPRGGQTDNEGVPQTTPTGESSTTDESKGRATDKPSDTTTRSTREQSSAATGTSRDQVGVESINGTSSAGRKRRASDEPIEPSGASNEQRKKRKPGTTAGLLAMASERREKSRKARTDDAA